MLVRLCGCLLGFGEINQNTFRQYIGYPEFEAHILVDVTSGKTVK